MVGVTNSTDQTPVLDVKLQRFTAFRASFGIQRKNMTLQFLKLAVKSDSTEMFIIISVYPQKRDHTSPNKLNVVFFPS